MKIAIINSISGCGKDTVADKLYNLFDEPEKDKHIYSLARPAKDFCLMNLGYVDKSYCKDILQRGREIDPDIWVKKVDEKLEDKSLFIVPDVRQLNEARHLEKLGFRFIFLYCDAEVARERRKKRTGTIENRQEEILIKDKSEVGAYNDFTFCENRDIIINNSGDLNNLNIEMERIRKWIKQSSCCQL